MSPDIRILTAKNISPFIAAYEKSFADVGKSIQGLSGRALIETLKRKRLDHGPYPDVTLFEAANGIMSDLVILHGGNALLVSEVFPFVAYTVELGNENNNGFDIRAHNNDSSLIGEAFNVASSFFPVKKAHALKRLRKQSSSHTHTILMFNSDAVDPRYNPRPRAGERFVLVDIARSSIRIVSNTSLERTRDR